MRTAFIETLCELAERDERIWLLSGDLGYSVLEPFAERFPSRYINMGIAEQNMAGVAAGLALTGKTVFVYSIANFPTLRCLEQIRNDICYHQANVKIVAVGGGYSYGSHGYTHHGVEDIAIMRALPYLSVVAPGDPLETRAVTKILSQNEGPAYLRLGKAGESIIHQKEPVIQPGVPLLIRKGKDVALCSTGAMLKTCLDAAILGENQGKSVAVYSFPWIKPLIMDSILPIIRSYRLIISVEEANASGGLGGILAEIISETPSPCAILKRLGCGNSIIPANSQDSSRAISGIDSLSIQRLL